MRACARLETTPRARSLLACLFAVAIAMPSSPPERTIALAIDAAFDAAFPLKEWLCFAAKLFPVQGMAEHPLNRALCAGDLLIRHARRRNLTGCRFGGRQP